MTLLSFDGGERVALVEKSKQILFRQLARAQWPRQNPIVTPKNVISTRRFLKIEPLIERPVIIILKNLKKSGFQS